MSEFGPKPTPEDAKISEHPISAFNLNVNGQNPSAGEFIPTPELTAEMADVKEMTDPDTGQRFRYVKLNHDATDQVPLIHTLAYSISLNHAGTMHEVEQIAMQHHGPIIVIENLSTGESDNLFRTQKKQLESKEADNFGAVAEPMLRALREQGVTEASFDGMSMGARIGASLFAHAAEYGIAVDKVILMDPPGLTDRALLDMANRFIAQEGANQGEYAKLSSDPFVTEKEPGGKLDPLTAPLKHFGKLGAKDLRANFKSYVQAMMRGTIAADITAGLESQPNAKVILITGGASRIADRDSANETYNEINEAFPDRIRMKRLPGDTHAMAEGQATRMGWYVSESLKDR